MTTRTTQKIVLTLGLLIGFIGLNIMMITISMKSNPIIFGIELYSSFILIFGIVTMFAGLILAVASEEIKTLVIAFIILPTIYFYMFTSYFNQLNTVNSFKEGKILSCKLSDDMVDVSLKNGWKQDGIRYIMKPDNNGWVETQNCKIK